MYRGSKNTLLDNRGRQKVNQQNSESGREKLKYDQGKSQCRKKATGMKKMQLTV